MYQRKGYWFSPEERIAIVREVQRNIERFPEDFMFQLTKEEFENLRSQIATSSDFSRPQNTIEDEDSESLRSQFATIRELFPGLNSGPNSAK